MALPPAYEPFRPVLELLSRPLAAILCGQLIQFEPLARGLEMKEFAQQGEFEGLGGLTHHGEIDHILQSELLLRTEAPLEFLRRLAESEMLYHDRVFADPGTRQIWRVIVSVGPDVLGHGRLIALASIFFLARVAVARDAEFHWCFVPKADGAVWFTDLSVNTIKRFLRVGAFREADADDIAAARESWRMATGERCGGGSELADWVIGSARDWGDEAPTVAAERNSLGFVLHPPMRNEPRQAAIVVRRNGHELHRSTIELAADALCLSALEKPFPSRRPNQIEAHKKSSVPDMPGWEPRYLSALSGNYRALRLADGILVARIDGNELEAGSWFVPLAEGAHLAGISIEHDFLCLLWHRTVQGEQRLFYRDFELVAGQDTRQPCAMSHVVPSEHLFRDRPGYALPSMTGHDGVEFHSTSGNCYRLTLGRFSESKFETLYREPRVVLSTGAYHVVDSRNEDTPGLQVFNRRGEIRGDYVLPNCTEMPKSVHGILWLPHEKTLAFAAEPRRWAVVPEEKQREARGGGLEFEVEPWERVLEAAIRKDGARAVVWSDAALGGEGKVEFFRFANGKRRRERAALDLGPDAARIVAIQQVNSEFWTVSCDEHGRPCDLVIYTYNKHNGSTKAKRLLLDDLRASAVQLNLEGMD